jgi:dephospho-CoA kinase
MLRVGLTGGIGAGKSTVANRLAEHGAVVIDSDKIAREVVEPGSDGLAEIADAFGEEVLTADGALDRAALAAKAFADDESRRRLNGILHPRIGARTGELMAAAAPDAIVVHDIPLLVENGLSAAYHLVVVVAAPEEIRLRRLVESRGMSEADAAARIAAQATDEQRRAAADVWLDNSGAQDVVLAETDTLWADRLVRFEANLRLQRARAPRPPKVVPYDDTWPAQAERALARIRLAAGDRAIRIDHIGSTSVPGLVAKDILDLQLTVSTLDDADKIADAVSAAGFPRATGSWYDDPQDGAETWPKRFHFGGDPGRPVNLHVRSQETGAWRLALLFRDWIRAHPGERGAYGELKLRLAEKHNSDTTTEPYTEDKQGWLNGAFQRAETWAASSGWSPES